jgi:hypothetical protein
MVNFLKFVVRVTAILAGMAWTLVTWFLREGAEAERGLQWPGLGEYRDWDGTIRPYTYDRHGNPTPGEGMF